eukprot:CAMPEP_0176371058 /NCGR_PEP_ID=MMETSP0126-20121128/24437_1 /TAXON_ID=141414 ORGANISM="Strombidinopsis acuminatum, Strain SPMC142" /NCGR_SAMPLE_ID=MMETSP0126 /ASSEMBLY_ACC=CAM_ASM_000229 /LENGTH=55 /DNA_ID=CAMNT_0017730373 /DNA_START=947 /DNA_END=1114 /DNA_ORIENTATION=-
MASKGVTNPGAIEFDTPELRCGQVVWVDFTSITAFVNSTEMGLTIAIGIFKSKSE